MDPTAALRGHFELQSPPFPSRWDHPAPRLGSHQPRMLTNVIPELVQMLSQPEMTSPGLLVLKTSSKFDLLTAWITWHATIPQPEENVSYVM